MTKATYDATYVGPNIRALRGVEGWTQAELAEDLEVTKGWVSRLESGSALPSLLRVIELAELFQVTVDSLLTKGAHK
jgi:transcriptional regulator with XRE-family HTH domain